MPEQQLFPYASILYRLSFLPPVQRRAGPTIGRLFFAERARELIDEWFYEK